MALGASAGFSVDGQPGPGADIVVAVSTWGAPYTISFWRFNTTDKSVTLISPDPVSPQFTVKHLVAGNFDGDGWPDFVASPRPDDGEVLIYTYDGTSYVSDIIPAIPSVEAPIAVGNIDGIGIDEIVVSPFVYQLSVSGEGWVVRSEHPGGGSSVALGDVDGDGDLDLLVGDSNAKVEKLRNAGQLDGFQASGLPSFFDSTSSIIAEGSSRNDRLGKVVAVAESEGTTGPITDLIVSAFNPVRAAVYLGLFAFPNTPADPPLMLTPPTSLTPDTDPGAGNSWAARVISTGNVDADPIPDVLVSATAAPACVGGSGTGGRAYLFLNYSSEPWGTPTAPLGSGRISIGPPNRAEITWDTNQFGWGSAIVGNYIFISSPGDQRTYDATTPFPDGCGEVNGPPCPNGEPFIFRRGAVHVYEYTP